MNPMVLGFISLVLQQSVFEVGASVTEPDFASPLQNVTIVAGREARLACIVENLDIYKVAFVHYGSSGSAVLTVGTHVLTTNRRVSVQTERDSWTLVIANSTVDDRGEYMCQISTVPAKKMYGSLEVQVPPHISVPPNDMTVDEGANVTLECQAEGDPPPRITWKREDGAPSLVNGTTEWTGETLSLPSVTRLNSGAHLCVASNGVPPAVSARVQIFVNYPPIILPNDTRAVWATLGDQKTFLSCGFLAYPKPNVSWANVEKNSLQDFEVHTEFFRHDKGVSRLYFRPVLKEHFGLYKCSVENEKGHAQMTVNLIEKVTTTTTTTTPTPLAAPTSVPPGPTLPPPKKQDGWGGEKGGEEVASSMLKKSRGAHEGTRNASSNAPSDNSLAKFFDNLLSKAGVLHQDGPQGSLAYPSAEYSPGGINIKQYDLARLQGESNNVGESNPPNRFVQDSPLSEIKGRTFSLNEGNCGSSFTVKQQSYKGSIVVCLTFLAPLLLF